MSRLTLLTGEKEVVKYEMLRRFVPTPGGVTIGADKFNPVLDMVHREGPQLLQVLLDLI